MVEYSEAFVGIDVAKGRNAIAIADGERGGEVRYLGEVDASPASMMRLVRRLAGNKEAGSSSVLTTRLVSTARHPCVRSRRRSGGCWQNPGRFTDGRASPFTGMRDRVQPKTSTSWAEPINAQAAASG
jgi:hypothetical protein